MASVSLGAISFLPPSSLHSGSSAQSQPNQHHQLVHVNNNPSSSNITVSFSNHAMPQGMNILEEEDSGESKLEIIEEIQEETSPKETETPATSITSLRSVELKKNRQAIEESKFINGNRMRSCLMDDNMSSKEAVESLLLLGQEAVVATESQTGVRQRAASMSQMPYRRPTSSSVSTQDGSNWGSGNSSFNSQQNQIRQRASSMTSAFPSRSHSAASSNLSSAYSSPLARRYSSASSDTISEPGTGDGTDMRNSYYQRMRERNNEASKRCRLKRRLKYETMEHQGNMLGLNNRWLKQRVARLDGLVSALREGVYAIRTSSMEGAENNKSGCKCTKTLESLKKINDNSKENECYNLSNSSLINNSKNCRDKNTDLDNVLAEEIGQGSIRPRLPSFTNSNVEPANQKVEIKQTPTMQGTNHNSLQENRLGCIKDKLQVNMSPSRAVSNAIENVMISEQSIQTQPHPVILRKEISSLSMDRSTVTLPGRCELSVTPLIKPLTPRIFPSTVISPVVTANPVSVVSLSSKPPSHLSSSTNAVLIPQQPAMKASPTKQTSVTIIKTENCQKPSLTALDVLNDTIVKSFDSNNTEERSNIKHEQPNEICTDFPLNLVKNSASNENVNIKRIDSTASGINIRPCNDQNVIPSLQNAPKQFILHVGKNGNNQDNSLGTSQTEIKHIGNNLPKPCLLSASPQESVVIKCEPDFSIVECKSPSGKKISSHTAIKSPEIRLGQNFSVSPTSCSSNIASRIYNIPNPKNDLEGCNGMESIGEKIVPNISTERTYSPSSTLPNPTGSFNNTEKLPQDHLNKAIINNNSVVISVVPSSTGNLQIPANSNASSSVQYTPYITNEPQLSLKRELTPSSSLIVSPQQPPAIKIQKLPLKQDSNQLFLNCNSVSTNKVNGTGQVHIQAITQNSSNLIKNNNQRDNTVEEPQKVPNILVVPSSDGCLQSLGQNFETTSAAQKLKKINQLNQALTAINPSYKPVGFSITSLASCSPNVLEDAIDATETAVSTLMSVIAPGEEAFLWKEMKKRLDKKLKDIEDANKNDKHHLVNQDGTTESEKKTALAKSH